MTAALLFLFLLFCETSAYSHRTASVIVTPNKAQYFEYEEFTVSCQHFTSLEWTVWRYTLDGLMLSQCGSGWGMKTSSACIMKTVKRSASGVYWCQSEYRDNSNIVNITVTDAQVILQSPVLPVIDGHDVDLQCKKKNSSSYFPAKFYKNGTSIGTYSDGRMTINRFSKSNEGAYTCSIENYEESPTSWLLMEDDSAPVSLTASPDTTQWFEYDNLSLNCTDNSGFRGWVVKRSVAGGTLSSCGEKWGIRTLLGCNLLTTKVSDSSLYWCESPARRQSSFVNIIIHQARVILMIPVLPVMEGHDVTLHCKTKTASSNLPADFYKDGSLIGTEPTGSMTIYNVTKSDEGLYKCNISSHGESPPNSLFVRVNDSVYLDRHETVSTPTMILHIVVWCPYIICTVLMLSVYHQKPSGRLPPVSMTTSPHNEDDEEPDLEYDDVTVEVTTEHHF